MAMATPMAAKRPTGRKPSENVAPQHRGLAGAEDH